MVFIQKGQSLAVGVAVVIVIIGLVGFGIYYFAFRKPQKQELNSAKTSAKETLLELQNVGTDQAQEKVSEYYSQVQRAETVSAVNSIEQEVNSEIRLESKRASMIEAVKKATSGSFQDLTEVRNSLLNDINSATSTSALNNISSKMEEDITSEWRSELNTQISSISGQNIVKIRKNSKVYESHVTKDRALSYINNHSWEVLSEVKFIESNSFEVPVIDTFKNTPTIKKDTRVNVYEYGYENNSMQIRVENTKVLRIIYPKDVLSSISWSRSEDLGGETLSYNFNTNVWEEIKASTAGIEEAQQVWNNWAENVVNTARENANLGNYDLQAIYVLRVSSDQVAQDLIQIEKFEGGNRDLALLARD